MNGPSLRKASLSLIIAVTIGGALNRSESLAVDHQNTVEKDDQSASHLEGGKAYLGMRIEDLHPAIASHLPSIGSTGQGVMVHAVAADSPAAKAGIKPFDILLTYDDQKLYNHGQLLKLVGSDKPGREVAIGLIREGKREIVKIQLGERPAGWIASQLSEEKVARKPIQPGSHRDQLDRSPSGEIGTSWNRIDSIVVKRLDENRFRALLTHFDKDGNLEKHEYDGTREELRKLIDADDDLKMNERYHLLRSLDISDRGNPWQLFPDDKRSSF